MDKCPFCGAERDKYYSEISGHNSYLCGSFERDGKILRSRPECYEAELAALNEHIEVLETCLQVALDGCNQLPALKSLVREMGELMCGDKVVWSYQVTKRINSILSRPEVKAIMEEKE